MKSFSVREIFKAVEPIGIFAMCAVGIMFGSWALALANVIKYLGTNYSQLGIIMGVSVFFSIQSIIYSGSIFLKFGLEKSVKISLFLWGILFFVAIHVRNLYLFSIFFVLSSLMAGIVDSGQNIIAANALSNKPGILLRFHGFYNIFGALGAFIFVLLLEEDLSWQFALSIFCALVSLAIFVPVKKYHAQKFSTHTGFLKSFKSASSDGLIGLVIVLGLTTLVESSVFNWGVLFLRSDLAFGLISGSLGFILGQLGAGLFRYLTVSTGTTISTKHLTVLGSLISGISIIVMVVHISNVVSIISLAVSLLSISLCWPLIMADASKNSTVGELSLSAVTTGGYLGVLIGPMLVSFLSYSFSLSKALLAVGAIGILGAIVRDLVAPKETYVINK